MNDGDGIFFTNFRADRAREIMAAIAAPGFDAFETGPRPNLAACLGMVEYSDEHNAYMTSVFPKQDIRNTLGAWVARHGLRQFRLAETEKYPHVTFFLNGGKEEPETGEDRFMPKSPNVSTYDLKPGMSAPEVTDAFVEAIGAGYDLIVTNYANPDMVGHTGNLDAAINACEAVDHGLACVVEALHRSGGAMLLTADHGNCETMVDPETGEAHTRAHHEPRASRALRRTGTRAARRRTSLRPGPDGPGTHGTAPTGGNDRKEPDSCLNSRSLPLASREFR